MLKLVHQFVTAWRDREWFGPTREVSPTQERELRASARRERQRLENRLHRTEV